MVFCGVRQNNMGKPDAIKLLSQVKPVNEVEMFNAAAQ
jgi:hypothetical protein